MLSITRAREIVVFCTQMGLKAEHDRAVANLQRVTLDAKKDPREADTRQLEAAQAVQDIETRMREHEVEFVLEALPRKEWAEWVSANPPRPDNDGDRALGLDVSALDEPIASSIREVRSRATGEPVDFDVADWSGLADEMSNAQWDDFGKAVLRLNNSERGVPFSPAASNVMRRSEPTSKPLSD